MSLRTVKCLRDESDAFKQSIFGWNCIEAVDQPPKGERYIKYDNNFNDWIVPCGYTKVYEPPSEHDQRRIPRKEVRTT